MTETNSVPYFTHTLAYLRLAVENMQEIPQFTTPKITNKKGKSVSNKLYKFYCEVINHVNNLECFVTKNFAGKFCLNCGAKVPSVLYCDECSKLLFPEENLEE